MKTDGTLLESAWRLSDRYGFSWWDAQIVAAILDETLPPDLTLFDLAVDPPTLWEEQRRRAGAFSS